MKKIKFSYDDKLYYWCSLNYCVKSFIVDRIYFCYKNQEREIHYTDGLEGGIDLEQDDLYKNKDDVPEKSHGFTIMRVGQLLNEPNTNRGNIFHNWWGDPSPCTLEPTHLPPEVAIIEDNTEPITGIHLYPEEMSLASQMGGYDFMREYMNEENSRGPLTSYLMRSNLEPVQEILNRSVTIH